MNRSEILNNVYVEGVIPSLRTKEISNPITELELVEAGDIDGVNYVTGSEGLYKTIIEKNEDGGVLKTTTLKYENSTYPTKVTSIEEV